MFCEIYVKFIIEYFTGIINELIGEPKYQPFLNELIRMFQKDNIFLFKNIDTVSEK